MGEPLSTAAGVVGIVVPAMHGTRLLLEDIKKIRGASDTVAGLQKEIEGVFLATEGLKAVQPSELESLGVARQSLSAIETCDEACETFRKKLQRWTKHSPEDGKLSRRDRINVGFFQEESIKALSTRLQTCKTTLISAVSTATLHSSIRLTGMTTEIRQQITTTELQIAAAIKVSEGQLTEVEKMLTDVSLKVAGGGGGGGEVAATDDKSEALKQIAEERKELSESRKILEALLAKTKDISGISVTNIKMSDDGQILAGLVNTGGKYVDARVTIDNVTATSGGQGVAGIVEGLDLNAFFNKKGR